MLKGNPWFLILFLLFGCAKNRQDLLNDFRQNRPVVTQKVDSLKSLNGFCVATFEAIKKDSAFVINYLPVHKAKIDSLVFESRQQVFISQRLRGEALHCAAIFDSLDTYAELSIRDEEKLFPALLEQLPKVLDELIKIQDTASQLEIANKSTRSLFTFYRNQAMVIYTKKP